MARVPGAQAPEGAAIRRVHPEFAPKRPRLRPALAVALALAALALCAAAALSGGEEPTVAAPDEESAIGNSTMRFSIVDTSSGPVLRAEQFIEKASRDPVIVSRTVYATLYRSPGTGERRIWGARGVGCSSAIPPEGIGSYSLDYPLSPFRDGWPGEIVLVPPEREWVDAQAFRVDGCLQVIALAREIYENERERCVAVYLGDAAAAAGSGFAEARLNETSFPRGFHTCAALVEREDGTRLVLSQDIQAGGDIRPGRVLGADWALLIRGGDTLLPARRTEDFAEELLRDGSSRRTLSFLLPGDARDAAECVLAPVDHAEAAGADGVAVRAEALCRDRDGGRHPPAPGRTPRGIRSDGAARDARAVHAVRAGEVLCGSPRGDRGAHGALDAGGLPGRLEARLCTASSTSGSSPAKATISTTPAASP